MSCLNILVGMPGAGKSTFVEQNKDNEDIVLNSDKIRVELFGSEYQGKPSKVFSLMRERCLNALKENKTVWYDATNFNHQNRLELIREMKPYCDKVEVILVLSPIEVLISRNIYREERHVPIETILSMFNRFEFPDLTNTKYKQEELIDKLWYINTDVDYVGKNQSELHLKENIEEFKNFGSRFLKTNGSRDIDVYMWLLYNSYNSVNELLPISKEKWEIINNYLSK